MNEEFYASNMINFWSNFDSIKLNEIYRVVRSVILDNKKIYIIGNGGSCAIASHMMTDYLKGGKYKTKIKPKIISLTDNCSLITAISNDISYDKVFVMQLESLFDKGDLLISISSSGNSNNIIEAINFSNSNHIKTISLTGFDGGKAKNLANYNFHVPIDNYGIVEDIHQSILHIIVQKLRYEFRAEDNLIY